MLFSSAAIRKSLLSSSSRRFAARSRSRSRGMGTLSGIENVAVVGGGTLGTQVSLMCAITGHNTKVLDVSEDSLKVTKSNHEAILRQYVDRDLDPDKRQARAWTGLASTKNGKSAKQVMEETLARLSYTTDPADAMDGCQLVNENVPEVPEIKGQTYASLAKHVGDDQDIIFTTNSSTLLPSDFIDCLPEKHRPNFLALHFANQIWDANIGEVMPHPDTDPTVTSKVLDFAKDIRMVPLYVQKEQNGYLINSLLVPWLAAAQSLVTNGVSTPQDVDRSWLITTGAYLHPDPSTIRAPFIVMDQIGLGLVSQVMTYWGEVKGDDQLTANGQFLKTNYVDKSKPGITNGDPTNDVAEGIYKYPNPEWMDPKFI